MDVEEPKHLAQPGRLAATVRGAAGLRDLDRQAHLALVELADRSAADLGEAAPVATPQVAAVQAGDAEHIDLSAAGEVVGRGAERRTPHPLHVPGAGNLE